MPKAKQDDYLKRQRVQESKEVSAYDFEGTKTQVLADIERLFDGLPDNARISYESWQASAGSSDLFVIYYEREENDTEYAVRVAQYERALEKEKKAAVDLKARREAQELELYEKLRKKFGDK